MKTNLTKKETWRLCDLAIRRMVDFGIEEYGSDDQKLLKKIQKLKQQSGVGR